MKKQLWPFSVMLAALMLIAAACGDDATTTDAANTGDEMSEMSDEMEGMEDGEHGHGDGIEVPEGMAVPQISISAEADTVSGHNLFIELADFTITPENASTEPVDGQGHMHLYIDGERTLRFYNTVLQLSGLSEGDHEVMVEVSANNHSAYLADGAPIRAMTTISVEPSAGHAHGDAELFETANAPTIEISIEEDPKSGWNLFADVSGLTYAPENVGGDAVDGEGHLHLYIDGERITRLYGPWWHIAGSGLEAGDHEVMVEISGNDHTTYAVDGEPVMATATLNISEAQAMLASAGHDDDDDESHDMEDGDSMEGMEDDEAGHGHEGSGEVLDIDAADADVVVTASLIDEDLTMEDRRIIVEVGQTVGIMFESDTEEVVHVHGYDILSDVGPDTTVDVAFLADEPGTFEVELEDSGRFLFEIQVS